MFKSQKLGLITYWACDVNLPFFICCFKTTQSRPSFLKRGVVTCSLAHSSCLLWPHHHVILLFLCSDRAADFFTFSIYYLTVFNRHFLRFFHDHFWLDFRPDRNKVVKILNTQSLPLLRLFHRRL